MLQFGNKEFRNLQEQVLKNMKDIQDIEQGATVLADFGIKVIGQVDDASELPNPATYEGDYGDAYIVGTEEPYEYYIFTRAFEGQEEPSWFDLGIFPVPGPVAEVSAEASAGTLPAGSSATASVSVSSFGTEKHLSFVFGIPKGDRGEKGDKGDTGAQGVQGVQGIQGPVGPQGVQGIQGEKGDPGYLYTIIGQEDTAQDLPDPSTVRRDSAFLVGYQEPYDVYVIIGTDNLEWINLGEIATVRPQVYIASDTYAESGTLDASTLASIIASTDMHYIRDGSILFQRAGTVNGVAYYTSIGIDTGSGATEVGYFALDLSDGSWEVSANTLPTDISNYVTTNTAQTITADKTMDGAGIKFTDSSNTNPITFKLYLDNYNNLIVDRSGQPSYLFATSQLSGMPGGTKDLGSDQYRWNDLYLKNSIQIKNPSSTGAVSLSADAYNGVSFTCNGYSSFLIAPFTSYARGNFCTTGTTYKDLGSTTYRWGDAYLSGTINIKSPSGSAEVKLSQDEYNRLVISKSTTPYWLFDGYNLYPDATSTADVGRPTRIINNIYANNISDGTNSVPVANLVATTKLYKHALLFRNSSNYEFTVYIVSNDSTAYQTDYAMAAGVSKSLAIVDFSESIFASKYLSVVYSTVDDEYQLVYINQTSASISTLSLGSTFVSDTVTSY